MSIAKKLMVAVLLVSGSMFGNGDKLEKQVQNARSKFCYAAATIACLTGYCCATPGGCLQASCYATATALTLINAKTDELVTKQPK